MSDRGLHSAGLGSGGGGGGGGTASTTPFTPTGTIAATNVQAAIAEAASEAAQASAMTTALAAKQDASSAATDAELAAHTGASAGAHAASAISNTPAGGVAATTVQGAVNELDTEKAPLTSPTFTGTVAVPTASLGDSTTKAASTAFARSLTANVVLGGTAGVISTGTSSLDLAGRIRTTFRVTSLGANHDLTVTNPIAGAELKLAIAQDSGGGHTFSVNGTPVTIDPFGLALSIVTLVHDGTDWLVEGADPDLGQWPAPGDRGVKAWNLPPEFLTGSSGTPTAGQGFYMRVPILRSFTASKLLVGMGVAATTASNWYLGLFNSAGTRVGVSADWGTTGAAAISGVSGFKAIDITVDSGQSLALAADSYVWVGMVWGTFTGTPTFRSLYGGSASVMNWSLTAGAITAISPLLGGTLGSGLSALPQSITPGSIASGAGVPWIAIA